jgi:hypothetical protein
MGWSSYALPAQAGNQMTCVLISRLALSPTYSNLKATGVLLSRSPLLHSEPSEIFSDKAGSLHDAERLETQV